MDPGSTLRYDRLAAQNVGTGLRAVSTFIVMFVFAITKFRDGAWIIVILVRCSC